MRMGSKGSLPSFLMSSRRFGEFNRNEASILNAAHALNQSLILEPINAEAMVVNEAENASATWRTVRGLDSDNISKRPTSLVQLR